MAKETAIVICPGRGTYMKDELGYLQTHHQDKAGFIADIDAFRTKAGQPKISELDGADAFKMGLHGTGDNAAALIYACAIADFLSIDRDKFEIVAVTGNSMGWYLALAAAGVLDGEAGINLVNSMGTLMHNEAPGGQVIYSLVDENWRASKTQIADYNAAVTKVDALGEVEVYTSINMGGMVIAAANEVGVKALLKELPPVHGRYPFALLHHAAFHSPLMQDISAKAKTLFAADGFGKPRLPLIDGRGHIWQPLTTDIDQLRDYTLGHQVTCTYDYSAAIEVAVKEFAPDRIIILGPGSTLGAPTAQLLIRHGLEGLTSKADFAALQKSDPYILSMGLPGQRALVV
jgi:[acyl-carrier-protein] S-malonyltransferase